MPLPAWLAVVLRVLWTIQVAGASSVDEPSGIGNGELASQEQVRLTKQAEQEISRLDKELQQAKQAGQDAATGAATANKRADEVRSEIARLTELLQEEIRLPSLSRQRPLLMKELMEEKARLQEELAREQREATNAAGGAQGEADWASVIPGMETRLKAQFLKWQEMAESEKKMQRSRLEREAAFLKQLGNTSLSSNDREMLLIKVQAVEASLASERQQANQRLAAELKWATALDATTRAGVTAQQTGSEAIHGEWDSFKQAVHAEQQTLKQEQAYEQTRVDEELVEARNASAKVAEAIKSEQQRISQTLQNESNRLNHELLAERARLGKELQEEQAGMAPAVLGAENAAKGVDAIRTEWAQMNASFSSEEAHLRAMMQQIGTALGRTDAKELVVPAAGKASASEEQLFILQCALLLVGAATFGFTFASWPTAAAMGSASASLLQTESPSAATSV